MLDISLEINGRKIRPNQVGGELENVIQKHLSESISKSLKSVRCAQHGLRPKVKCSGRRMDRLIFEINGCCEDLIQRATKKLT